MENLEIRDKLAQGLRRKNGDLQRLIELENTLEEIEESDLSNNEEIKERIKNEISVLRFDISTLEGTLKKLHKEADRLGKLVDEGDEIVNNALKELTTSLSNYHRLKQVGAFLLFIISLVLSILISINNELSVINRVSVPFVFLSTLIYVFARYFNIRYWYKQKMRHNARRKQLSGFYDEIKEIERHIYFVNKQKTEKANIKGNHSSKREWLSEHFYALSNGSMKIQDLAKSSSLDKINQISGVEGSDNLIAQQLCIIYEQEFGTPISKESIKGLVKYLDR